MKYINWFESFLIQYIAFADIRALGDVLKTRNPKTSTLANIADPDDLLHKAACHEGLKFDKINSVFQRTKEDNTYRNYNC